MSNEPVAYINMERRSLEWAKPMRWETPTVANLEPVPLYAHPAPDVADVNDFNPDWDVVAPMVEEQQRMAARIQELEAALRGDVEPVAWSVFDKRTQKHWYTNESVNTAGYYAKEYSHREADGSPSMSVVPLYENPQKPLTDDQIDALVLPESGTGTVRDLVRIVEAAHGIGRGK